MSPESEPAAHADELRADYMGRIGEGIGLIWAEARGGAIGRDGAMPWHLPEDLAHFKRETWGAPVVMGRRTWESLPERFRPLPGRANIVVTRDAGYRAEGAVVAASLEAAIDYARPMVKQQFAEHRGQLRSGTDTACIDPGTWPARAMWVMGGGQLYRAAMPLAEELVVTRIDLDVPDADTFAPEIGPEWQLADPGEPATSATGLTYRFERYLRGT